MSKLGRTICRWCLADARSEDQPDYSLFLSWEGIGGGEKDQCSTAARGDDVGVIPNREN